MAKGAVCSTAVALLLFIYSLMYFLFLVEVLCLSLFCCVFLCVHFSFAIILKRKRNLVYLLLLSYRYVFTMCVLWLFLAVPWVDVQCVNVVFSGHTHLPFDLMLFYLIFNGDVCSIEM